MTHGSLFSGIGGFDLAAEWMEWENVFHCEINKFCQKVLKYYWPNATLYEDITKTDFSEWRGKINIVTGGFPCQPYSQAGKRKGKGDDRHLWPDMLRAIREIQPCWIVGENVPGLLNWQRGMVLAEIKADLEAAGFEVFPPVILPACGKNAPHRRDRLWIVAYGNGNGCERGNSKHEINTDERKFGAFNDVEPIIANNSRGFMEKSEWEQTNVGEKNSGWQTRRFDYGASQNWDEWPTQPAIYSGNDGLPRGLVGITAPRHRTESIMAYGNAIVPQIAYEIFKAIESLQNNQYNEIYLH